MRCAGGCLDWNTMVLLANGSEKRISEIQLGASVRLNTQAVARVVDILRGFEQGGIVLTTCDGKTIKMTRYHPVLKDGDIWVRAEDLKVHDSICTETGTTEIAAIMETTEDFKVFNLMLKEETGTGGIIANGIVVGDYARQISREMNVSAES